MVCVFERSQARSDLEAQLSHLDDDSELNEERLPLLQTDGIRSGDPASLNTDYQASEWASDYDTLVPSDLGSHRSNSSDTLYSTDSGRSSDSASFTESAPLLRRAVDEDAWVTTQASARPQEPRQGEATLIGYRRDGTAYLGMNAPAHLNAFPATAQFVPANINPRIRYYGLQDPMLGPFRTIYDPEGTYYTLEADASDVHATNPMEPMSDSRGPIAENDAFGPATGTNIPPLPESSDSDNDPDTPDDEVAFRSPTAARYPAPEEDSDIFRFVGVAHSPPQDATSRFLRAHNRCGAADDVIYSSAGTQTAESGSIRSAEHEDTLTNPPDTTAQSESSDADDELDEGEEEEEEEEEDE